MKSQRNQARSKRVPASRQKNPRIKIVKGLRVSYKFPNDVIPTKKWSIEQYENIKNRLKTTDRECVKVRKEYNLFKEIIPSNFREVSKYPKDAQGKNPENMQAEGRGVISPLCKAEVPNDTSRSSCKKPFLLSLDVQCSESIAQHLPSFKMIQSSSISLNIGFDTKFQEVLGPQGKKRFVLSLQMSIIIGETLIRYFFLVNPIYQEITSDGGSIPLKYCLADILSDLKKCYLPDFPLILRQNIKYKESKKSSSFKTVDFKEMSPWIIPVTLICHSGKGDLSIFRRSKYDTDFIRKACEIQKGLMTPEPVFLKAENDYKCNYYWLINLSIRDTQGLSPAASKSLTDLGNVIKMTKISLSSDITDYLAHFAVSNPLFYYQYTMNDADIVISYCSELFLRNRSIPITLSSAAASTMCQSIKDYLGVKSKAEYDRLYRGLELLDEGIVAEENENLKFLKATRYVPIKDNPDAKWISEFFEEAYTGGFNAALFLGWITEPTTDLDLQNAYPTAMANIVDIDWSKRAKDFPPDCELTLQDLGDPLVPAVAVGDFDFPDDCYCPNIPVPVPGGIKAYPLHGRNVYMTGPDMYLALKLGAKIKISRGFSCEILLKDGKPSQCLAYTLTNLVQDRMCAKKLYKDTPIIEQSLKVMAASCYGKTSQNVCPKTRYSAKSMTHENSEPSSVTSPYHAAYTTALVRCMLIACINQLHNLGYSAYSVTTDGFITNAPTEVVRSLDAYGFAKIFQNGRYILNQTTEVCKANHVWEAKHYNTTFLNITTRGNVAVNDEGVLAHNSYTTGKEKDSRADRDAFLLAVLSRTGPLACTSEDRTRFSAIAERKQDFYVEEKTRHISMNFDFKRCPLIETAYDVPVHYSSRDGKSLVDAIIANYDTRPYNNIEEFLNYRNTVKSSKCIKTKKDLECVCIKSTSKINGYIGNDLERKQLLSILMGYRLGIYEIPSLDSLKQSDAVALINSWGIAQITINDWKNCSRSKRQSNMLSLDLVKDMLEKIQSLPENTSITK